MAERSATRHVPAIRIARMFAHAGDTDRALLWLNARTKPRVAAGASGRLLGLGRPEDSIRGSRVCRARLNSRGR